VKRLPASGCSICPDQRTAVCLEPHGPTTLTASGSQLPMIVQGKPTEECTFADPIRAILLSGHGCLTTLSASVRLGERVVARNIANGEEQHFQVVYLR